MLATSKVAPCATESVLVCRTPVLESASEPPESTSAPEKVLVPDNVSKAPVLVKPLAPLIAPESSTSLPNVRVRLPVRDSAPLRVSLPVFVTSPRVRLPSSTSALANVRAVVESLANTPAETVSVPVPRAASLAIKRLPELRLTPPENVLVPANVNMLEPVLERPPLPLMIPENTASNVPPTVSVLL